MVALRRALWVLCSVSALGAELCDRLDAVVVSEIHYNPPFEEEALEFIELTNETDTPDGIVVLKGTGRFRFDDACKRTGWDEATLLHMDEYSESYRFYWFHSMHQTRDNWRPLMDLTTFLHEASRDELDRDVALTIDLEPFLKVLGARTMMHDRDALLVGLGHNGYVLRDPTDGLWEYLPLDMGAAALLIGTLPEQNADVDFFAVADTGVRRLLSRPIVQRVYFRVLQQAINGYWSDEKAGPYMRALEETNGIGRDVPAFLRQSASVVGRAISRSTSVDFRIVTNGGRDFEADSPTVELRGTAPVEIADLFFQRGDGELERFEPTFKSATLWEAAFAVEDGVNVLHFFGADSQGNLTGPASITIVLGARFRRGDVNASGRITVTDVVDILGALFQNGAPACADAADVNDDGTIALDDAVALASFLFRRGTPPAPPFVKPGTDPSDDDLGCARSETQR